MGMGKRGRTLTTRFEHQDFSQKENDGGAGLQLDLPVGHLPRASFPSPPVHAEPQTPGPLQGHITML